MDKYEIAIFENIERTQRRMQREINCMEPGELSSTFHNNIVDLNNHLATLIENLKVAYKRSSSYNS